MTVDLLNEYQLTMHFCDTLKSIVFFPLEKIKRLFLSFDTKPLSRSLL